MKVAFTPEYVTTPATGAPPRVNMNVAPVSVAGSIASLKTALTLAPTATSVAASSGTVERMVGAVVLRAPPSPANPSSGNRHPMIARAASSRERTLILEGLMNHSIEEDEPDDEHPPVGSSAAGLGARSVPRWRSRIPAGIAVSALPKPAFSRHVRRHSCARRPGRTPETGQRSPRVTARRGPPGSPRHTRPRRRRSPLRFARCGC